MIECNPVQLGVDRIYCKILSLDSAVKNAVSGQMPVDSSNIPSLFLNASFNQLRKNANTTLQWVNSTCLSQTPICRQTIFVSGPLQTSSCHIKRNRALCLYSNLMLFPLLLSFPRFISIMWKGCLMTP